MVLSLSEGVVIDGLCALIRRFLYGQVCCYYLVAILVALLLVKCSQEKYVVWFILSCPLCNKSIMRSRLQRPSLFVFLHHL